MQTIKQLRQILESTHTNIITIDDHQFDPAYLKYLLEHLENSGFTDDSEITIKDNHLHVR